MWGNLVSTKAEAPSRGGSLSYRQESGCQRGMRSSFRLGDNPSAGASREDRSNRQFHRREVESPGDPAPLSGPARPAVPRLSHAPTLPLGRPVIFPEAHFSSIVLEHLSASPSPSGIPGSTQAALGTGLKWARILNC